MGKQISYMTLIGVHSTMLLMHPNVYILKLEWYVYVPNVHCMP